MRRQLIVSDPDVMMGKPVIRGTRITVELILEKLATGFTVIAPGVCRTRRLNPEIVSVRQPLEWGGELAEGAETTATERKAPDGKDVGCRRGLTFHYRLSVSGIRLYIRLGAALQ